MLNTSQLSHFRSNAILVFVGLILPLLGSTVSLQFFHELYIDHTIVHSIIELTGSAFALLIVPCLFRSQRNHHSLTHNQVICSASAIAGMGILDAFHAVAPVGNNFVWLHSIATFVGGVLFASIWISEYSIRFRASFFWAIFVGAIALGTLSFITPDSIPPMVSDGKFTLLARALNILGGLGFIASTVYMVRKYHRSNEKHYHYLASHCLLFGSAGILFELSSLWDAAWWWWHLLRLAAYFVLIFFYLSETQQASSSNAQYDQDDQETVADTLFIMHRVLASLVFLLGATVIIGWYIGDTSIIQLAPNFAPMQYNTALGFILASIGVFTFFTTPIISRISAILVLALSSATLLEYLLDVNFGIDQLFMDGTAVTTKVSHIGRMAPNTALCFALAGLALLARNYKALSMSLATTLAILTVLALSGYILKVEGLYGLGSLTRMAIHTAGCFALLSLALFTIHQRLFRKDFDIWKASPLIVMVVFLTVTFFAWHTTKEFVESQNQEHFQSFIDEKTALIKKRFAMYEQALLGGVGFFNGSDDVTRSEWKYYVNSLRVKDYLPGSNGIGFINLVRDTELKSYINDVRKDDYPSFINHPDTHFSDKFIIKYIEPLTINEPAVGLDIGFEAHRREAAEHARDSGELTLTKKILLVQDRKKLAGFLLLAPVYKGATLPETTEERREKFLGWVYSPFMARKFMADISELSNGQLSFRVYDGKTTNSENIIYEVHEDYTQRAKFSPYQSQTTVTFANQLWTIAWRSTQLFKPKANRQLPSIILVVGSIISILSFGLFYLLSQLYGRSAQRRREAEAQFRSAMEYSTIGIALVSPRGRWLKVNKAICDILGYDEDELLKTDFQTITHTDDLNTDLELVKKILRHEIDNYQMEKRYIHKDGHTIWALLSVSIVWNSDGSPKHFLSQIQDITDRKHAEEEREQLIRELKVSNEELDNFAYVASHDLKAPLRVIDNASKWLEEDLEEYLNDDTRESMELLRNRITRMEKLLDDLLEYSRIGKKTDGRFEETLPASILMDDILQLLAPPDTFTVNVAPEMADIHIHRMPLQQILLNLVSNAIKHHDKKQGTIDVSAKDEGTHYTFIVKDDGPGIAEEFHEQVFKMFQTLKPRDQVEGSGMGLAMVHKNIEIYGGKLTLESAEGEGCTFRFSWPKTQPQIKKL